MLQRLARGEIVVRERGVDEVVVERDEGEALEAAEDGGEGAGEVGAGEVERDNGGGVANDAVPFAWRVVFGVPVGEDGIGVVEVELGLVKV